MPPGAPGRYLVAKLEGQDVGIGTGDEGTTAWSTHIAVEDADATVRRLVASGAKVLSAPADAGEGRHSAALVDPQGARFRVWRAKQRPGARIVNRPDIGYGFMVRSPGYGDRLEATADPDIRARQSGFVAPPVSGMRLHG